MTRLLEVCGFLLLNVIAFALCCWVLGCQSAVKALPKALPHYFEAGVTRENYNGEGRSGFNEFGYMALLGWHLTPTQVVIAGQGDHPWRPGWLGEPPSLEDTPPLVVVDPVAQEALEALREALVGLQEAMAKSAEASERTAKVLERAEKTISAFNKTFLAGGGLGTLFLIIVGGRAAKRHFFPNHQTPSKETP